MKNKEGIEKWKSKYWLYNRNLSKKTERFERRVKAGRYFTSQRLLQARNSLYLANLRTKATGAEIIFGDYLWKHGVYFQFQKAHLHPYHRIFDFYLPQRMIAFEIDGSSHEGKEMIDFLKDKTAMEKGVKVIRITNQEVFNGSFVKKVSFLYGTTNS